MDEMWCGYDAKMSRSGNESKLNEEYKKEMKRVANDESRDRMREVCEQKQKQETKRNGR